MLDERGHISEGSGENIFVVQDGQVITPPPSSDILVGITRDTVMTLVREELGMPVVERDIDRTELYTADECFMTGTAAHVTPVVELDRRKIGDGKMGPVSARLVELYFDIITGRNAKYAHWCTPCFSKVKA